MPGEIPPLPSTTPASISLKEIANWDGSSEAIYEVLTTAFDAKDYRDCIENLPERGIDQVSYIDNLDKVRLFSILRQHYWFLTVWAQIIDTLPVDSALRRRCLRALRKTCGIYGVLPTSYTITNPLSEPGQRAFSRGGFSAVWRLADKEDPQQIFAVKSLFVCDNDPLEKIRKVRGFRHWMRQNCRAEVRSFDVEVLQRGNCLQAIEACKHFVHRRRDGREPLRVRDSVPVDGKR